MTGYDYVERADHFCCRERRHTGACTCKKPWKKNYYEHHGYGPVQRASMSRVEGETEIRGAVSGFAELWNELHFYLRKREVLT